MTNVIYLDLSPLDDLGRVGVANAVLGPESDSYSHLLEEGYKPCGICNPD